MKHNLSKTRLYSIYSGMKQRCYNPNNQHYKWYGGKGITICNEWLDDNGLQRFIEWALNNGYEENLSIDRVNPNGNYAPDNCRWVTPSVNSVLAHSKMSSGNKEVLNMSFLYENNEQITIEIKKLLLEKKTSQRQIAEALGITPQGFTKLLNKKNFGFEDAKKILNALGYNLICDFQKKAGE